MNISTENIVLLKKMAAIMIIAAVMFAPIWLARKNSKGADSMLIICASTICFGWTGLGWLVALYLAAK